MVDLEELRWQMWLYDFTVTEVAQKIGICENTMYNKLHGETEFTVSEAGKIARLLRLDKDKRDEIFFGEERSKTE